MMYYFWIFMIGSFIGWLEETIWCIIKNRRYESRKGLLYFHLIPIYGVACLIITMVIKLLKIKNGFIIFLTGALICSVVEYACSFLQEKLLGTKSWDYKKMKFNLFGRINLLYSMFFGLLSLAWINLFLPLFDGCYFSLNTRHMSVITEVFVIFVIFDMIISFLAVYRMNERKNNVKRKGKFWNFIDKKYNDDRVKRVYANLEFV